jgi:hypothetical protein
MSIDKNESGLQIESKFSSLKNLLLEELNHLNGYILDLGLEYSNHSLEYFIYNLVIFKRIKLYHLFKI